ncbi:TPA: hypothetical protein QDE50_34195 [Burkholderia cenocepacia]|uniref:hypothetical protein n=1 Tax=Burkholderia cenocepacia TaxID=95486 RepID=UPI002938FE19|nr:hypothetical protein [Burkholderia cenocepacia]MDV3100116.1 hypothetical protein [Burkholderia cenocepacia]HDR9882062.1 hypothetical protein [Burkholderia cenocepacia]HDR9889414.1 hypothetical protein [Burkholderia cenocepacia]
MAISIDEANAIYRQAIESRASDGEGAAWWNEIADEVRDVVDARTISIAAELSAWWHHDWRSVSDTPRGAATRNRDTARSMRLRA